jgi:hypothetical protein
MNQHGIKHYLEFHFKVNDRIINISELLVLNYTHYTLKFGFRYKRDVRDNRDFKDLINNKNRFKNRIFKCNEYICFF